MVIIVQEMDSSVLDFVRNIMYKEKVEFNIVLNSLNEEIMLCIVKGKGYNDASFKGIYSGNL